MKPLFAILALFSTLPSFAEAIFSDSPGAVKYALTENPESHVKHYVATYIPSSISASEVAHAPALIFLHGGSAPQSTPEYGKSQIEKFYMVDWMKQFAEERKVILIMPGSHIGWNADSIPLLKNLKRLAIAERHLDSDSFYLAGHSMGAMGAIRLAGYLREEFRAFIALSGTLNPNQRTENYVRSLLGMPLYIVNEEEAAYESFLTDSGALKEYMENLAVKYAVPSVAHFKVSHGNHNSVLKQLEAVFLEASQSSEHPLSVSDQDFKSKERSSFVSNPVASGKWVGNVTCGTVTGTRKKGWRSSEESMFIDMQSEEEGFFDVTTGKIDRTYPKRSTTVELLTYHGGTSEDFVKAVPHTLANLTATSGPHVCIFRTFVRFADPTRHGYLFSAGASQEDAEANLLLQFKNEAKF